MLDLDRVALGANLPLPLLELDLELRQPRFTLVERGRSDGELLFGAHAVAVGLGLLLQTQPERLLPAPRSVQLGLEPADVRADGERLAFP